MRRVHQLGCHLVTPNYPINGVVRYAVLLDRLNFDHVRVGDHALTPDPGSQYPNSQALLSVIGSLTQRAMISTGVTDPFRRHPIEIAHWISTEDHLTKGRIALGLGGGEKMNLTPFGIDYERPLRRLREAIQVIRLLWTATPRAPVTYEGEIFRLSEAYLQIQPVQKPMPAIYVGAMGKRTRELSGELADGWVAAATETPSSLKEHLKDVRRGASKSTKKMKEPEVVATVYTDITSDQGAARKRLDAMVRFGLVMDGETLQRRAGMDVPEDLTIQRLVPGAPTSKRIAEFASQIPVKLVDDIVDEMAAVGTRDDCIEKMEEFLDAGATSIMMCNIAKDQERVFRAYARDVIPYLRKQYGH